jgi:hypothetical protein
MNTLKVNEYLRPDGKYQVTIAPNVTSYWSWNYKRLVSEYPKLIKELSKLGFTNSSRDLYLKGHGLPAAFNTQSEANATARLYKINLAALYGKVK